MIASPLAAVVLSLLVHGESMKRVIFFVETFGVWSFAAYWWIKTLEMRETDAEQRGLDGELEREAVAPVPAGGGEGGGARAVDKVIRRVMVPNDPAVERIVPAGSPAPPKQPRS